MARESLQVSVEQILAARPDVILDSRRSPWDEEAALQGTRLPLLHRDPFDRMLLAQVIIAHSLAIVTPIRRVRSIQSV